ncbi:MAG: SLC13 family permease [Hyphomicrobiales bacterium]
MELAQGLSFAVIAGTMALFIWGRWSYDVVAVFSLLTAVAVGIVPADEAFSGFSDDILFIIAGALIISAAVSRSGVVESVMGRLGPYLTTTRRQVLVLTATVTLMSGFVKNIGALAILIPVALQLARRTQSTPANLMMPLAFGSLLGGIVTLVGTTPNIVVSRLREDLVGEPFRMFDFAPVGATLAVLGVIFLTFAYRILPSDRKGAVSMDEAFKVDDYITEAQVLKTSAINGKTLADLEKIGNNEVEVTTVLRRRKRHSSPASRWQFKTWDVLLLQGEPAALSSVVTDAGLKLVRHGKIPEIDTSREEIGAMEAIVGENSSLVGKTPVEARLYALHHVNLLAVSRGGRRVVQRISSVRFRAGDVIVLSGNTSVMPETLRELDCLPLAQRELNLGRARHRWLPFAVLAAAMLLIALHLVPVSLAFFGAAFLLLLAGSLTLSEAYDAVEWPILVLFGALIPVSRTLQTTGAADLVAGALADASNFLPGLGTLALMMVVAMAVTPFLNNAATVLVMAPIAAGFAKSLGYSPDPFLMAVAVGAGCDFLTPIGHQSNTLVMGPGGYRFGDYWKLGLPLSVLVVVVGVPLIALFWPL